MRMRLLVTLRLPVSSRARCMRNELVVNLFQRCRTSSCSFAADSESSSENTERSIRAGGGRARCSPTHGRGLPGSRPSEELVGKPYRQEAPLAQCHAPSGSRPPAPWTSSSSSWAVIGDVAHQLVERGWRRARTGRDSRRAVAIAKTTLDVQTVCAAAATCLHLHRLGSPSVSRLISLRFRPVRKGACRSPPRRDWRLRAAST